MLTPKFDSVSQLASLKRSERCSQIIKCVQQRHRVSQLSRQFLRLRKTMSQKHRPVIHNMTRVTIQRKNSKFRVDLQHLVLLKCSNFPRFVASKYFESSRSLQNPIRKSTDQYSTTLTLARTQSCAFFALTNLKNCRVFQSYERVNVYSHLPSS
ncbi:hypothetical protein L596_005066 [Steinernema carpocapsae]|uniref:Uncharacterized protein n=1 Tax=Steinernema carpocapsae TaxID=34508 RepID=A0A4U8UXR7_STECR|nr:hypothetical protein L596_005066 [Steinernema carpocapsae]